MYDADADAKNLLQPEAHTNLPQSDHAIISQCTISVSPQCYQRIRSSLGHRKEIRKQKKIKKSRKERAINKFRRKKKITETSIFCWEVIGRRKLVSPLVSLPARPGVCVSIYI